MKSHQDILLEKRFQRGLRGTESLYSLRCWSCKLIEKHTLFEKQCDISLLKLLYSERVTCGNTVTFLIVSVQDFGFSVVQSH